MLKHEGVMLTHHILPVLLKIKVFSANKQKTLQTLKITTLNET